MNGIHEKAELEQLGPFTFQKKIHRDIKGFSDDGLELTFKTTNRMYFRPELSNLADFDKNITTLNVPFASLVAVVLERTKSSFMGFMMKSALSNSISSMEEKLFKETTPREFIMNGYDVPIMESLQALRTQLGDPEAASAPPPSGRFSLMQRRNGTNRGEWTVYTGRDTIKKTGTIKSWNNMTSFSCWAGDSCNEMKGSEGAFFPPPITKDRVINIFSPELSGSIRAKYSKEIYDDNIRKFRFNVMDDQLISPLENEENSCYCASDDDAVRQETCQLDGILRIGPCNQGAPVVLSKPHFYLGSPVLGSKFEGLEPDPEKHASHLDIDPYLGLVSRAIVRMQTNVDLTPLRELSMYSTVPSVIFPSFWLEDIVIVDGENLKNVVEFQGIKRKIDLVIRIIFLTGVGLLSIAVALYFATRRARDEYGEERKMVPGSGKGKKSGHAATADDDDVKVFFLSSKDPEKTVTVNANGVQVITLNGMSTSRVNNNLDNNNESA